MNLLNDQEAMESWRAYFETAQRVTHYLEERLKAQGSDLGEYNILLVLAEAEDHTLTASELASRIVFSLPRLNYRIGRLEEAGLVKRMRCPSDGRASNISLTDAGMTRFLTLGKAHYLDLTHLISHLGPDKVRTLGEISNDVKKAL